MLKDMLFVICFIPCSNQVGTPYVQFRITVWYYPNVIHIRKFLYLVAELNS